MRRKGKPKQTLETTLIRILETAEKSGDSRTVLAVVKMLEEREKSQGFRIRESSEWKDLRDTMIEALKPFPDAMNAILKAIEENFQRSDEEPS